MIGAKGFLSNYLGTGNVVAQCCAVFPESGQFGERVSFSKTGRLWELTRGRYGPWETIQKFGLEHGACGTPKHLSATQMCAVIDFPLTEFHALPPDPYNRFFCFVRSEFHVDVGPDSLRTVLQSDPRPKAFVR
jgi:hypothetical protein